MELEKQIMTHEYRSLVSYIKNYDFELCLNSLFFESDSFASYETFLRRLQRDNVFKEMEISYLDQYFKQRLNSKPNPPYYEQSRFPSRQPPYEHSRNPDYKDRNYKAGPLKRSVVGEDYYHSSGDEYSHKNYDLQPKLIPHRSQPLKRVYTRDDREPIREDRTEYHPYRE